MRTIVAREGVLQDIYGHQFGVSARAGLRVGLADTAGTGSRRHGVSPNR
jgi:hypothetical protein